jgi:hypothetical protein
MGAGSVTMTGSTKGRGMGRRRKEQPPEVRKSFAAKFGARLESLALAAGFDAKKFGGKLGKSDDMIRLYYAGTSVPHINDWPKIARVLGVQVADLLP